MSSVPQDQSELHAQGIPINSSQESVGKWAAHEQRQLGKSWKVERSLLQSLLKSMNQLPVMVKLWDGTELSGCGEAPIAKNTIADRPTLWKLAFDPMFQFGDAYARGRVEFAGDLVTFLERVYVSQEKGTDFRRWIQRILHPCLYNNLTRSRSNVYHHYDIGNAFYERWLDRQLLYTCAYYEKPEYTLEEAQIAKMEHVCRKLRLRTGESVVEAGCGWGALALHMAKYHGVRVRAFNLSREQLEYARNRAAKEGLSERVEFVEDDWRNINQRADVFVSVGMLEHVGRANYGKLGDVIHRCLTPEGRALIHSIGNCRAEPLNAWIERRIFPGAYPPTLRECMQFAEPHSFAVLDVENLRPHYAQTLRHWLERFERSVPWVREKFDEKFVKTWRLYLSGSIAAFTTGSLQLFQILMTRQANDLIPCNRRDIYDGEALQAVQGEPTHGAV
jgi:cyclopropane-fatty-acyl-phospholipid synthase